MRIDKFNSIHIIMCMYEYVCVCVCVCVCVRVCVCVCTVFVVGLCGGDALYKKQYVTIHPLVPCYNVY